MHTTAILIVFTPAFLCVGYLLLTSIVGRLSQCWRRASAYFTSPSFRSRDTDHDQASQSSPVSMSRAAARTIEKLVPALSFRRQYVNYSSEELEPPVASVLEELESANDHGSPSACHDQEDNHKDDQSNDHKTHRGPADAARLRTIKSLRECAVCLCAFQEAERLRVLPTCGHAFHVACIDTWLYSHWNCPLCREQIKAQSSEPYNDDDDDEEEEEEEEEAGEQQQHNNHQEIITDQPDCIISMSTVSNTHPDTVNHPSITSPAPCTIINTNDQVIRTPLAPDHVINSGLSYFRSLRRCFSTGSLDFHHYDGSDRGTTDSDVDVEAVAGANSEITVGLLHQHQQIRDQPRRTSSNFTDYNDQLLLSLPGKSSSSSSSLS